MHSVVAILEAKPGKEADLEAVLKEAIKQCKVEAINIESRLHRSIENPAQFFLYENWESKEKYAEQINKPSVKAFISKVKDLLIKSPQVSFGKEL